MEKRRNNTLELVKLIASYFVVFIHVPFDGQAGELINALSRFAVPLFFLIAGFFSYKAEPSSIKKKAVYILKLYICSFVAYTIFNLIVTWFDTGDVGVQQYFINNCFNLQKLKRLLLYNRTIASPHLWYLPAMVYVYSIFYLVVKYNVNEKIVFAASLILLLTHFYFGEFSSFFDVAVKTYMVRNFYLLGIPCFGLGLMAKKYEVAIRSMPNLIIAFSLVVGVLETIASYSLLGHNELYIGSLLILFAIIVVCIKYPSYEKRLLPSFLCGCNTYIYILHIMVREIMKILSLDSLGVTYPLMVCLFSTVLACFVAAVEKNVKRRRSVAI